MSLGFTKIGESASRKQQIMNTGSKDSVRGVSLTDYLIVRFGSDSDILRPCPERLELGVERT